MENRRVSVKPILSIILILAVLCAVFTLTACSKELDAVSIEVVKDTIPDVATVGSFELSQLKLKVYCEDSSEQEIAITLSMLDTASKNSLKEPGEKNINVYYNGKATTFTIFLVEEGTKTVSVTFLGQDSKIIAKKHAVAGNSIEAPQAPTVTGLVFDSWRNKENSQEVDLSAVSNNLVVYAHYTENTTKYTVTFLDYNNNVVDKQENIPHNTTVSAPGWKDKPSTIKGYSWIWDFSKPITQNTTIKMEVEYYMCDVSFQYAYSDDGQRNNLFTSKSVRIGTKLAVKDLQDAKDEMLNKGLDFVRWFNEDGLITNTTRNYSLVAIVKLHTYNIEFTDTYNANLTVDSNVFYTMPQDAGPKLGYIFDNKWTDTLTGKEYIAGESYSITSNLKLEAVYKPAIKNYSFTFNFEELQDEEGEILSYKVNKELSSLDVTREYLSDLLSALKEDVENLAIANYDIKSVEESSDDIYTIVCEDATQRLSYVLNDTQDGYIVSGYLAPQDKTILLNINIPATYNDKPVVGIANGAFSWATHIANLNVKLTLSENLLEIGENAFNGVVFFNESITIPSSVISLGNSAFMNASAPIKDGITLIDIVLNVGNSLATIPQNAFKNFVGLKEVILSSSVKTIGEGAFELCGNLEKINLEEVITIDARAFAKCVSLANVGNLDKVATIKDYALSSTKLSNISLPSLTSIGNLVFLLTENLITLSIGGASEITFDFANIMGSSVQELTLGANVTALANTISENFGEIGKLSAGEVYALSKLATINFAKELAAIDVSTFNLFPLINTITVEAGSIYAVLANALFNENSLVYYPPTIYGDFEVPATVNGIVITHIAKDAFIRANFYKLVLHKDIVSVDTTNCATLNVVEMPLVTLEAIFGGSIALSESVTEQSILDTLDAKFKSNVTYFISDYAELEQDGKDKVDLLLESGSNRFIIEASALSSYYDNQSKLLYTVDKNVATVVGGNHMAKNITIPATLGGFTVSYIADGAFSGFIYLETLTIDAIINNLAIVDAFSGCENLATITLAGLTNVATINYNLFNDTKLYKSKAIIVLAGVPVAYNPEFKEVKESDLTGATIIPVNFFRACETLTSIVLPNSITEIQNNAFEGCISLKTIDLKSVTTVGKYVFKNCTALQSVVIPQAINKLTSEGRVSVGMFYNCSSLTSVIMEKVDSFAHENGKSEAFYGCTSLEDISFLNRFVGIIYEDAFKGCSSIKSINLTVDPNGNMRDRITEIRANAFANCTSLSYLEIGTVNALGSQAFAGTALKTIRIRGIGGIFAKRLVISAGVFPADVIIYMDSVDVNIANEVLANYPNRKMAEPRINFEMLDGFKADESQFNMSVIFSSYMETSPVAPSIDGYVFVSWFIENIEGNYVKAAFPMTFTENKILKAKYYSESKGSIVFDNLVHIVDNKYRLGSYTSTDDICYIPYKYMENGKECYIQEINLSIFADTNITNLVIPEGVTKLTGSLVDSDITEITIASTVTDITSNQAFTGMNMLNIKWAENSNLVNASLAAFINTKWYTDANNRAKEGANKRFVVAGRLALQYVPANTDADKSIEIPNNVIKLNNNLFPLPEGANPNLYTKVTTITLNDGLKIIGNNCFVGLINLVTVNYQKTASDSTIESVSLNAFPTPWVEKQNQIIIGKIFLKYRGLYAVNTFSIPAHITTIAPNAFESAELKEILFAGSAVTTIGKNAFKGSKLVNITLPSSVTTMGEGVFEICKNLQTANFSNANITYLPVKTFLGCSELNTLVLSNSVTRFDASSLNTTDGQKEDSKLLNITADGLSDTTGLTLSGLFSTKWIDRKDAIKGVHLVLGKVYVKYIVGSNPDLNEDTLIEAVLPNGVTVILSEAFMGIINLGKITIPASVETIEISAFKNCTSLKEVIFADGSYLKTIGKAAFSENINLNSITLPERLLTIGDNAFDASALKSIVIPNSVTTIGKEAFANNTLENVVLGQGLIKIGEKAFANNDELYKVNWNLEVVKMDNEIDQKTNIDTVKQLYYMYLGSKTAEGLYTLDAKYVNNIFFRESNMYNIRIYISSDAQLIVAGSSYAYLSIWMDEPEGEDEKYFEIVKEGELPEVDFDKDGYIMESFRTEIIEQGDLKTPSRTGHTFVRWEVSGTEITFPYQVRGDIELKAIWESNAKSNTEFQQDGSISGVYYQVNIINDQVVSYTIIGINEGISVMYVPSTIDLLPVVGFDVAKGSASDVKKIIFTQASNFFGIDTNIFENFENLEAVELLDRNLANVNYKVENGAMYTIDGKELIAYFIQKDVTSFQIPNGVVKILPNAFVNSGLVSIAIPRSVTTIGKHAFNDGITTISFTKEEKEIAIELTDATRESFENTQWYQQNGWEVNYSNNSPIGKFYAAANILLTYEEMSETHTLNLPNQIKGIDITVIASNLSSDYSAENKRAIAYNLIVLPSKLKKINSAAFAGIDALDFDGKNAATTLVDIADDVFTETEYYKTTTSDDGLTVLGKVLLRYQNTSSDLDLTKIEKTKNITTISKQAFMGSQFSTIKLPETLKYIADEAFLSNTKLKTITIPMGVESIGASAFKFCTELKDITFADDSAMLKIGNEAFSGCHKLTLIKIPYTVTTVGDSAFSNCLSLETVTFDKIQVNEDEETKVVTTTILNKSELTNLGASAFQDCTQLVSISIPNKLVEIKESTFKDCTSLVDVIFETDKSKVKYIRKEAFYGCVALGSIINIADPSLITLVLPNSLITLEDGAFAGCEGLYGVQFNYSISNIGKDVFLGCITLAKIEIYADSPPEMPSSALKRETDTKQPYYNLRIYVKNVTKVLGDYNDRWAEYTKNIFPMGDYAKLSYKYTAEGTSIGPIEEPINKKRDVYVNHSYEFPNRVKIEAWTFSSIIDPRAENPEDIIIGASRLNKQLGGDGEAYAYQKQYNKVTASYDVILVVDYDIILQNLSQ